MVDEGAVRRCRLRSSPSLSPRPFRPKTFLIRIACVAIGAVASGACSDPAAAPGADQTPNPVARDSGVRPGDAGSVPFDAGSREDAGKPPLTDGGTPPRDAGNPDRDADRPRLDAGRPRRDAGQLGRDSGLPPDAGQPRRDAGQPAPGGSREDILTNLVGFGEGTTGGAGGSVCRVTSLSDSGSGSLRACTANSSPTWVVFDVSGNIDLNSAIRLRSNTTIDGRGQDVTIRGFGLQLRRIENVVLHNLRFDDGTDDAIMIRDATDHVWVDHVSLSGFGDGLIDITNAATDVTVSWCELSGHDKVMLISANPGDSQDVAIR